MSYEKLGFTKGQTLKADHLNHMEEGISNAGGAGFEYWNGEVEWDAARSEFKLYGLRDFLIEKNAYEVEVGIRSYFSSDRACTYKASMVLYTGAANGGLYAIFDSNYRNDENTPKVSMHDNVSFMALAITHAGYSGAMPVDNPEIMFIRVYPGV